MGPCVDSLELEYELNLAVKRGLSYYLEGNGFEVRCPVLGAQQHVVGGGACREGAIKPGKDKGLGRFERVSLISHWG